MSDRGRTSYDWQHYIPLAQRKPAALVAAELVLETGAVSAEHVLNLIGRLNASAPPQQVETALRLNEAPRADTDRYDRLRDAAGQEADHA